MLNMDSFFKYDPQTMGAKGVVLIGDKVLCYRRDDKTDLYPLYIDLPGGGPEPGETPFDTFKREVKEEFDLEIKPEHIVYEKTYPSKIQKGKYAHFPVAKLPSSAEKDIKFGPEGLEYLLLSFEEFVSRKDVWPVLQDRAKDYAKYVLSQE